MGNERQGYSGQAPAARIYTPECSIKNKEVMPPVEAPACGAHGYMEESFVVMALMPVLFPLGLRGSMALGRSTV